MNLEECFSQIDSCEFECEGGPLRLNVGYIQLKSNTAKLEQQLAEQAAQLEAEKIRSAAILESIDGCAGRVAELRQQLAELREALTRIRDCDWVITLPDRMDAVREIAREALDQSQEQTP